MYRHVAQRSGQGLGDLRRHRLIRTPDAEVDELDSSRPSDDFPPVELGEDVRRQAGEKRIQLQGRHRKS